MGSLVSLEGLALGEPAGASTRPASLAERPDCHRARCREHPGPCESSCESKRKPADKHNVLVFSIAPTGRLQRATELPTSFPYSCFCLSVLQLYVQALLLVIFLCYTCSRYHTFPLPTADTVKFTVGCTRVLATVAAAKLSQHY